MWALLACFALQVVLRLGRVPQELVIVRDGLLASTPNALQTGMPGNACSAGHRMAAMRIARLRHAVRSQWGGCHGCPLSIACTATSWIPSRFNFRANPNPFLVAFWLPCKLAPATEQDGVAK
jgi:hypothetical protein